jgi:hypothetical protein
MKRLIAFATVALLAGGAAHGQQPQLPPEMGSPGQQVCYEIHSSVPFTVLTHVMLPSLVTSVARIGPNETQRHCIEGSLPPGQKVTFRIVSGLGPPLFSCQTRVDKPIFISANKGPDDSWTYQVTCY